MTQHGRMKVGKIVCLFLLPMLSGPALAGTCPGGGADLDVKVENTSDAAVSVSIAGSIVSGGASCTGGGTASSYSKSGSDCGSVLTNIAAGTMVTCSISGLASGIWKHSVTHTPSSAFTQYQRNALVIDSTAQEVSWRVFKHNYWVTKSYEDAGGTCTVNSTASSTCTLGKAITAQNALGNTEEPALILLSVSPNPLPTPMTVDLSFTGHPDVTVDGTDSNGLPWVVGDATAAGNGKQSSLGKRVLFPYNKGFKIGVENVTLKGIEIAQNTSGDSASSHLIERTSDNVWGFALINARLDSGITSSEECDWCGVGNLLHFEARNMPIAEIDVRLRNVEARNSGNFGLRVDDNNYGRIEYSWFHNNRTANISTENIDTLVMLDTFVERAGLAGDDDELQTVSPGLDLFNDADTASAISTHRNVIRNNSYGGAELGGRVELGSVSDQFCGNGSNGLTSYVYSSQTPKVNNGTGTLGLGLTYNEDHGADLKVDPTPNAVKLGPNGVFTANGECGVYNDSSGTTISAITNQWREWEPIAAATPTPSSLADVCPSDPGTVDASSPITNAPDANVLFTGAFPSNAINGQALRVEGSGFDAIGGNPLGGEADCTLGADGSGESGINHEDGPQSTSCCKVGDRGSGCDNHQPPTIAQGGLGKQCVELYNNINGWFTLPVRTLSPQFIETEAPNGYVCVGGNTTAAEVVKVTKRKRNDTTVSGQLVYCTAANSF